MFSGRQLDGYSLAKYNDCMIQTDSSETALASAASGTFANAVQREIYRLVKNYESCDRSCMLEHGVTAAQGYTLLCLPRKGGMAMSDLSEAMGLAGSTMTRMVDPLVQKGLASRAPDNEDRRIVRVALTEHGREVQRGLEKELEEFFAGILAGLSEERRRAILDTLKLVNLLFEQALAPGGDS